MAGGRPTDYSPELAEIICERLVSGESLRAIARDPGMPDKTTMLRWLNKHEEFRTHYAQARDLQAEGDFDDMEELAATATPETVQIVKLQIDTRKWVLSRKAPKKYGDKISQEISGPNGSPIQTEEVSDLEKARRIAFVLMQAAQKQNEST